MIFGRLLAIETATAACSVALVEKGLVRAAAHEVVGRGHAERLLPMIAGLPDGGRADAIRVDIGPGSFTGIRVGVAAARALGFAWGIPVAGFTSLALIAAIDGHRDDTAIAIEGGHGELFVACYGSGPHAIPPRSLPFDIAVAALTTARIVGNAAERVVAARGWGEALAVEANAAFVFDLADDTLQPPIPFYGRQADAIPLAALA